MRYVDAKRIIQPNNNFNLYRGCSHGCIYCDSRSTCYEVGEFENIAVKKDAIQKVERELQSKRKRAILSTGGMSDPYVHLEKELCLTQGVLKLIQKYRFGVSVLTKSDLILRDLEIYKNINDNHKAIVQLTITTTDDELAQLIEPNVARPSKRFEVLRQFADCGITTGIWMTPILPFIEDKEENIVAIIEQAKAANVKFILSYGFGTTMREGSRDYFYDNLDKHFPGMKQKYIQLYHDNYICPSPNSKTLSSIFEKTCERHGIIHDHQKIRELCKSPDLEQLRLF